MNNCMKNKTILILLAFALAAGVFNACKKEQANNEENKVELTDADRNVASRILKFRSRLEHKKANPMLKNTEIVSIDDARLDVETNFNASYSFPDEKYIKTSDEIIVITMPVTDELNTTVDNMLLLYDECFTKVLETYNNSTLENKELVFVSLKKGEIENGEININMNVVLGTKNETGYDGPFGVEDNWHYGNYEGKCDQITAVGSDAAEQIENMINSVPTIDVMPPYGYRYVYINHEEYTLEGNEFKNDNGENLIFWIEKPNGAFTSDEKCLDYNEMNFHFNGECEVIFSLLPEFLNKPSNWKLINCNIVGNLTDDGMKIHHQNNLRYAYRHLVRISEIDNPNSISTL